MAKFIITAHACEFQERSGGISTMSYLPMDRPLAQDTAQCKNPDGVRRALMDMRDRVRTAYAGSFFVSHRLERGERAPAGYRQMGSRLECPAEAPRLPQVGDQSPWGGIDHVTPLGPQAVSAATPSHGGIWVAPELLQRIPAAFRSTGFSHRGWFEEDCDWAIPYLWCSLGEFEPEERRARADQGARDCLKRWHPECWEAFEVADALASAVRKAG